MSRTPTLICIMMIALTACGDASKSPAAAPINLMRVAPQSVAADRAPSQPEQATLPGTQRHIAVRQFLVIQADHKDIEALQQATREACQPPQCELLESTFTRRSDYEPARATLRVRITPGTVKGFLADATRNGEVIEQRTESEDKTDQVIDVDARLRNLGELRERLRKLLKSEGAKLKDVVEIERELARVQAELESAEGLRKLLTAETSRTTLTLEWRARRSVAESGTFNALGRALRESGRTLADSLAALLTFLVAALPWLIVLGGIFIPLRAWWRRRKAAARLP